MNLQLPLIHKKYIPGVLYPLLKCLTYEAKDIAHDFDETNWPKIKKDPNKLPPSLSILQQHTLGWKETIKFNFNLGKRRSVLEVKELQSHTYPKKVLSFLHASSGRPSPDREGAYAKKYKVSSESILNLKEEDIKSRSSGEDSYFTRHDALAVADGISGWSNVNANPALYSKLLTHYIQNELEKVDQSFDFEHDEVEPHFIQHQSEPCANEIIDPSKIETIDRENILPLDVLQRAYQRMPKNLIGSSTITLTMIRNRELRIAHLGDCGVFVLRQGKEIYRTREQLHSFNFPFQLGMGCRSQPKDSDTAFIPLEPNDIVIVASDGLFDNLWDVEVFQIVEDELKKVNHDAARIDPARLSQILVSEARIASMDNYKSSPFANRASHQDLHFKGGKQDDISVCIGIVIENEDSPDRR